MQLVRHNIIHVIPWDQTHALPPYYDKEAGWNNPLCPLPPGVEELTIQSIDYGMRVKLIARLV